MALFELSHLVTLALSIGPGGEIRSIIMEVFLVISGKIDFV